MIARVDPAAPTGRGGNPTKRPVSDLGLLTMLAVRLRSRGTAAVIAETVVELHAGEGAAFRRTSIAFSQPPSTMAGCGDEVRRAVTP